MNWFWGVVFALCGYTGGVWLMTGNSADDAHLTLDQRIVIAVITLAAGALGGRLMRNVD